MINLKSFYIILQILILNIATSCSNNKNEDKIYQDLKSKIEKGLDEDQKIRHQAYLNMKKDTFDIKLNETMGQIDSINLISANAFLKNYGYPTLSRDGKKISDGIFNILQHNDVEIMEMYIDQLEERAFAGEASKLHFAMMKDRILMENNLKQIYGTQAAPRMNSKGYLTNDYYIWPIKNLDIVNNLRKEIGFDKNMEEYAKSIDAEFNLDEPLTNKN